MFVVRRFIAVECAMNRATRNLHHRPSLIVLIRSIPKLNPNFFLTFRNEVIMIVLQSIRSQRSPIWLQVFSRLRLPGSRSGRQTHIWLFRQRGGCLPHNHNHIDWGRIHALAKLYSMPIGQLKTP